MNLFKTFKLTWWQVSLFKLSLLSFGIIIGVHFADYFAGMISLLWILFLVPGLYLLYVWFKQR